MLEARPCYITIFRWANHRPGCPFSTSTLKLKLPSDAPQILSTLNARNTASLLVCPVRTPLLRIPHLSTCCHRGASPVGSPLRSPILKYAMRSCAIDSIWPPQGISFCRHKQCFAPKLPRMCLHVILLYILHCHAHFRSSLEFVYMSLTVLDRKTSRELIVLGSLH